MTEPISLAVEVIIDNSGSMNCIKEQVVDGLNEFIVQLSAAIMPAQLSITLFDEKLRRSLIDGVMIYQNPRIKHRDYDPAHGTENIAHSVIQALNTRLAPVNARYKALVVVTDGLNTSSQMAEAKKLVAKRQSEGWLILWFGVYQPGHGSYSEHCQQKLLEYAKNLGIPEGVTFAFDCRKIDKAMPVAAQATLRFGETGDTKEAAFTAKERALV